MASFPATPRFIITYIQAIEKCGNTKKKKGNIYFFHMIRHINSLQPTSRTYFLPSFKVDNIPEDNLAYSNTNRPKLNYSLPSYNGIFVFYNYFNLK